MNTPTLQPKGIEQDLVATGICDSRDRYAKPQARSSFYSLPRPSA
jgi:hypothetical protein